MGGRDGLDSLKIRHIVLYCLIFEQKFSMLLDNGTRCIYDEQSITQNNKIGI